MSRGNVKEPGDEGEVANENKSMIRTGQTIVVDSVLDMAITFVCISMIASIKFPLVAPRRSVRERRAR